MNEHPIYPGCHWPEFEEVQVNGKSLWKCTDCGCISDLPFGKPYVRHLAHCPRIPYLTGQKRGLPPRITFAK
jgi:hypothetical protein